MNWPNRALPEGGEMPEVPVERGERRKGKNEKKPGTPDAPSLNYKESYLHGSPASQDHETRALIPKDKGSRAHVLNVPWPSLTTWATERASAATSGQQRPTGSSGKTDHQRRPLLTAKVVSRSAQPVGWPYSLGVRPGRLPIPYGVFRLNLPASI